ncbi:transcriptional regulator [Weissella oryzae SG25]|uniref:Transcriptional regulator n=1 Tax=Weissella oryzae (strain DSM 25784 / JCM 18191 / LMG 30913 / SG25) TaxID=1329250 RepID=A0A069CYP7_WEIOS|nr:MerR family transcriptional regulator [Weissella oryzae]GAK30201.1 transcriptional regulator [Weissella oryzae SG25]
MAFINKHDLLKKGLQADRFKFRIGEIAKMTGVSTRQLRYWESKGIIRPIERESDEARVYNHETYIKVSMIKHFLDEGASLKVAVIKCKELEKIWRMVHDVVSIGVQGIGTLDGEEVVDLGFFDEAHLQRLYARRMSDNEIKYIVRDVNER